MGPFPRAHRSRSLLLLGCCVLGILWAVPLRSPTVQHLTGCTACQCRPLPKPLYTADGSRVCLIVKDHKGVPLLVARLGSLARVIAQCFARPCSAGLWSRFCIRS